MTVRSVKETRVLHNRVFVKRRQVRIFAARPRKRLFGDAGQR